MGNASLSAPAVNLASGAPDGHAFMGAERRLVSFWFLYARSRQVESRPALPSAAACTRDICSCGLVPVRPTMHRRPRRQAGRQRRFCALRTSAISGVEGPRGTPTRRAYRGCIQRLIAQRALAANRPSRVVRLLPWHCKSTPVSASIYKTS